MGASAKNLASIGSVTLDLANQNLKAESNGRKEGSERTERTDRTDKTGRRDRMDRTSVTDRPVRTGG